jgi:hypothetical protein
MVISDAYGQTSFVIQEYSGPMWRKEAALARQNEKRAPDLT